MPALHWAWSALQRFVTRANPVDRGTDSSSAGSKTTETLDVLDVVSNWLYRFERLKVQVHESERRTEQVRREMMRNERRATRRALVLLLKQLNPRQRHEFRKDGYFYVTGGSSGDRYRIRVDVIANIDVLRSDGMVKHRLCARLADDVPVYDVMAAQLLHLRDSETEQRFLQRANFQSTLPEDHVFSRMTWTA